MNKHLLKSLFLSIMMILGATGAWADDIDLSGYTLTKTMDFASGSTLTQGEEVATKAWDNGNAQFQKMYKATEYDGLICQSFGSNKAFTIASEKGLYVKGAQRCAAVDGLTAGQVVVLTATQNIDNVISFIRRNDSKNKGDNLPDGNFNFQKSEDGTKYFFVMTADGYAGFNGLNGKQAISKIEIYTPNEGTNLAEYTVRFVDTNSNVLADAKTYKGAIGMICNVFPADLQNLTVDGQGYLVDSNDASTKTVAADGSTVVTVTYKAVAPVAYSVKEVAGETVLRTTEGEAFTGTTVKVAFRKYNAADGQLYQKDAISKEYNYSFNLTQENQEEKLSYTAVDGVNNVVFCAEGEDIEGLTLITTGNTSIRSSNSASAYAPADTKITTLAAGKYKIHAVIYDSASEPNSNWTFMAGPVEAATFNCTTVNIAEFNSDEFVIGRETDIIMAKAGGAARGLDAIYIVKTGDVTEEEATAANTAADAAEALAAAKTALQEAITAAEAIETEGKKGVDALTTAIADAKTALNAAEATVESLSNAKTALADAVTDFEAANAPIYIETDLTAQFNSLANTQWTGSSGQVGWAAPKVTTNSGLEVAAWERYNDSCDWTGEIMSSSVTGLTPGTYKIELYGAAAFTFGRGFGSTDFTGDFSKDASDTYHENDAITENTGVTLFAETSEGTVSKEIPIWYATNFNTSGIATATLENVVVGETGTIKIGLSKTSTSTNWHVVQLKGVTAQVDAVELHANELAAAQAALNAEENAIVTGEEKTALETAIRENSTVAEQTADAYKAAIKALSDATAAFTGAKAAYEGYAAAQAYLVDLPYADAAKKPAAEAATNAADATAKAEALMVALRAYYESNAMLENVEGAVDMTEKIVNPAAEEAIDAEVWKTVLGEGSGGSISILSGEPWTDAAGVAEHKYFDGGDWGANAWDVTLQQDVTLPAGKYLLTAKMRASADVEQTLFAGENAKIGLSVGAAGGVFNRGWNDASIEFELSEEATIAIGVRGKTEVVHNWMSFSDFRLVQMPEKKQELILTLQGTVGEEVSIKPGVYGEFDIFSVDFGDGVLVTDSVGHQNKGVCFNDGTETWSQKEGTTHTGITEFKGTVAGDGTIKVYGNDDIWYLAVSGATLSADQPKLKKVVQFMMSKVAVESLDLTGLDDMKQFSFSQGSLKNINVKNNAALTNLTINNNTASAFESVLESLDLSGNANLEQLNVMGASADKPGKLATLDLSNNPKLTNVYAQFNALTSVTLPAGATLSFLNLQNNNIAAIDLTKVASLKDTYLNNNQLTGVDLSKVVAGANLYLDGNLLTTVNVPVVVKNLQLNNNKLTSATIEGATASCKLENNAFTLATLPAQPAGLNTTSKAKKFTYAPQAALEVAETVSELDLTSQLTVAKGELNPEAVGETAAYGSWIENQTTTFTFVTGGETPATLVEGTDYEVVEPGKFKFLTEQTEKVHAVMLNAAFPKFTETDPFITTDFTVEGNAQEPIYIEADLTAQFPTDHLGWTGATGLVGWAAPKVMTNDGREVAACERYESTCDNTGDVFTRTLTGLANGTYRIELYGAAAYTSGRGFESELVEGDETAVYLYAETAAAAGSRRAGGEIVKQYIPAHVADNFNGTGIATAVLDNVVVTDGTVKLGMYKEKPYTNWHVVQIKGVTALVDAVELHATTLAAAQTALAAEENAVVTGEEKTALETAITNNATVAEQTADAYETAINALNGATATFTGAKTAYADYADAKAAIVDLPYAKAEKKPAAEAATSAADATAKTEALIPALRAYYESNAMLENVEGAVDMTEKIVNPAAEEAIDAEVWKTVLGEGSGGSIDIKSNEPWTDAAGVAEHKYFDGGNWGANAWDVTLQQDVTLPAGKYLLTAKMRASADVEQTLFAGENAKIGLSVGAAGGAFNRGWNDTYVEFEVPEETTIAIGVRGVTELLHNWMSFSDFRLMQFPASVNPELPEGVIYSWESPEGTPVEMGGTIAYVNGDGDRLNYLNSGYYTICLNGKKANLNDEAASASAGHMVITLDEAVAEGDTIAITGYITKNSSSKSSAWIVFENGATAESAVFGDESNIYTAEGVEATGAINTKDVVVSAEAAGSKTITLTRGQTGTNLFITKLQVIKRRTTTGINFVKAAIENGSVYNLNGQKVNKAQKGLYIINGKKVIVK